MITLKDRSISSQSTRNGKSLRYSRLIATLSRVAIMTALSLLVWPACYATAQQRSAVALEAAGGWAGFVDDSTKHHGIAGGSARFYVTPRLALGPEFTYMRGPDRDRDFMLTGNLTFDLLHPLVSGPPRLNPYLIVGGGLFQHRDDFRGATFTSTEGAFTAGGGLRVFLTHQVYVAPEVRVGWELHLRTSLAMGFHF